jgi:hypothetical protein
MTTQIKGNDTSTFGGAIQTNESSIVSNRPMFKARLSANQTGITDGVNTKVAWDTADIDTHSAFDSTTNYRFTVPTGHAGKYFIGCRLRVDGGALNTLIVGLIRLRVNGVDREYCNFDFNNNYGRATNGELTTILDLTEGDYIEIYGYANTSGADATFTAAYHSILYGYKLIG